MADVNLYGRLFIRGDIRAQTGLHIGAGKESLQIGGMDNPVVRDPLTNRPYIPGSSLKGKMRSSWEKIKGARQNFQIGYARNKEVYIHVCQRRDDYSNCDVCPIYGVPGDKGSSNPTRLVVRDVLLGDQEAERLEALHTDLPYTEAKWEAAIDRVTSAAVPRPMERVPAGTTFQGFEMVFSIYDEKDCARFIDVLQAMQLLQDDYLGGQGSRGSGKIVFENLKISARWSKSYGDEKVWDEMPAAGEDQTQVSLLLEEGTRKKLEQWVTDKIFPPSQP